MSLWLVFEDEQNTFEMIMTSYQKTKNEKRVLQSVKEAFMVGENIDYFSKLFEKEMGITPKRYMGISIHDYKKKLKIIE